MLLTPSLSSWLTTLNVMALGQRSNSRPRLKGRDKASVKPGDPLDPRPGERYGHPHEGGL